MRSARHFLIVWSGSLALAASAQTTGSLRGRVVDEVTNAALPGATVQVLLTDTVFGAATDASGAFHFEALPTGIHRVRVRYVGYAPQEREEVWIRSGKTEDLEISMVRSVQSIPTVEVRASGPQRLDAIGNEPLTVERSLRFPATFFDPARLAMSYAGVASTNDQANHFSVRGNGPASNAWLLEGVEIVTPNHLTNAGTQSDLPTLTGGGTTILSAQMLGSSQLLMGPMSAPYGNALGGIMDLRLRPGNTERRAFTVQAGLIGIDVSAEGPFRRGGRASYLINYRYSTLGLLGAMGVALGDEAISFQDISFHLAVPMGTSELTLFGIGGSSSNNFAAKDSTAWEFDKDSRNIDYSAQVGAAGISFVKGLGKKGRWKTTAVLSANEQERLSEETAFAYGTPSWVVRDTAQLREQKLSVRSDLNLYVGRHARLLVGSSAMQRTVAKANALVNESLTGWLLRPYARFESTLGNRVQVDLGLAYTHWTANAAACAEPRASLRWNANDRNVISAGVGQRSQLPAVQNYVLDRRWSAQQSIAPTDNTGLGLIRSQDVEITYAHHFTPFLHTTISGFVQRILDAPVGDQFELAVDGRGYGLLNEWDALTVLPLTAQGEGSNVGAQFSLERTMHSGLFCLVNATVFNATYTDRFSSTFDSRWNTGAIANALLGREFVKQKEGRKRTWGMNGRLNYTGGQRYTPLPSGGGDVVTPYSAQLNATYRLDLRVYLKRERPGRTGMWSLDLLNATNAQNVAYRYNDQRKGQEVTVYQLGLIPNLSYRVEF